MKIHRLWSKSKERHSRGALRRGAWLGMTLLSPLRKKKNNISTLCKCLDNVPLFPNEYLPKSPPPPQTSSPFFKKTKKLRNLEMPEEETPLFCFPKPIMKVIRESKGLIDWNIFYYALPFIDKFIEWTFIFGLAYFGFSYGTLLFIFTLYCCQTRKEKDSIVATFYGRMTTREFESRIGKKSLPSWMIVSDMERAEWVNDLIRQLWKNLDSYATTFVKTFIEPEIKKILNEMQLMELSRFDLKKVLLGKIPLKIGGIKVFSERHNGHPSSDGISMEAELIYAGDARVQFELQRVPAEIKDIKLRGKALIKLKPLLNTFPILGGFEITFMDSPTLHYNLSGLGTFAEMPGISGIIKNVVESQIESRFVFPNKFKLYLPISDGPSSQPHLDSVSRPRGILHVHLIEASDLVAKDNKYTGSGKSDPYAIVVVNKERVSFRSSYVEKTLNPIWNYECDFTIGRDIQKQQCEVFVYDYDKGTQDDFMGKTSIDLEEVINSGKIERWISLSQTKRGNIHLRMRFLECVEDLTRAEDFALSIYIHSIKNLVNFKQGIPSNPIKCVINNRNSFAQKGKTTENEHLILEGCTLSVKKDSSIVIEVIDAKSSSDLYGELRLKARDLFESKGEGIIDGELPLNFPSGSIIHLTAKLHPLRSP